jgi:hypothetical protein
MSDQSSTAPSTGGQGGTPVAPSPTNQTSTESRRLPISQGKRGFRDRLPDWMAWVKEFPSWRIKPEPDPNFQLINMEDLDKILQDVKPEVAKRVRGDIQFMDHELLDLFRELDLKAKINQNRYRLYQILFIGLAAAATIIGSIQALVLNSHPQAVLALGLSETVVALFTTLLAQLSSREPPLPLWRSNRRRAEGLRREYFRYLVNLSPYDTLEVDKRKLALADRAANIYAGTLPAEETPS